MKLEDNYEKILDTKGIPSPNEARAELGLDSLRQVLSNHDRCIYQLIEEVDLLKTQDQDKDRYIAELEEQISKIKKIIS